MYITLPTFIIINDFKMSGQCMVCTLFVNPLPSKLKQCRLFCIYLACTEPQHTIIISIKSHRTITIMIVPIFYPIELDHLCVLL